jgi:hypothetical protein
MTCAGFGALRDGAELVEACAFCQYDVQYVKPGQDGGKPFGMSFDFTVVNSTYRSNFVSGKVDGTNLVTLPASGYARFPGTPVAHAGGPSNSGPAGHWRTTPCVAEFALATALPAPLPGRKVAHFANQQGGCQTPHGLPGAKVNLIVRAFVVYKSHRIKPVSGLFEAIYCIPAKVARTIVGCSRQIYPVQARASHDEAFAEKKSKIKNSVKAAPPLRPRLPHRKKDLTCRPISEVGDERAAIPGTPGRDCGQSGVIKSHLRVEFCEKYAERAHSFIAMRHQMTEVLASALGKVAKQYAMLLFALVSASAKIGGTLSMRRLVNRIVYEGMGHELPVLDEMLGVASQPAEHDALLC